MKFRVEVASDDAGWLFGFGYADGEFGIVLGRVVLLFDLSRRAPAPEKAEL